VRCDVWWLGLRFCCWGVVGGFGGGVGSFVGVDGGVIVWFCWVGVMVFWVVWGLCFGGCVLVLVGGLGGVECLSLGRCGFAWRWWCVDGVGGLVVGWRFSWWDLGWFFGRGWVGEGCCCGGGVGGWVEGCLLGCWSGGVVWLFFLWWLSVVVILGC